MNNKTLAEELKKLEDVHKINLERKLKELKNAHKIDLEKKLKELETKLHSEYKKLLNKKILEEQKEHSKELEAIFEQLFISSSNFASLNENTKNMFQRRILGLVSYYIGATPDKFAQKILHYVSIKMEPYFEEIYNFYEDIEEKKEKMFSKLSKGNINKSISTYSSYTRQSCNFIFPNISEKINGEKRPRPSNFKIKESDAIILEENKNIKKKNELVKNNVEILEYLNTINLFISNLTDSFRILI